MHFISPVQNLVGHSAVSFGLRSHRDLLPGLGLYELDADPTPKVAIHGRL
jgi:hypothetical protein